MPFLFPMRAAYASAVILFALLLFSGCATEETVEPDSAKFDLFFAPPLGGDSLTTFFENDTLVWHFDRALLCAGEIGIHWSRIIAQNDQAPYGLAKISGSAHDIPGGKPSPKIYEYFAVDLLKGQKIQTLTVGPAIYDHVHMVWKPATDTTQAIAAAPELKGHSLWVTGKVRHGDTTRPFTLAIDTIYKENDLGDVLFELEVRNGENFDLRLRPKLASWFNDVLWSDLEPTRGDTADLRLNQGDGAKKIANRYHLDNAFVIEVDKHGD